MENFKKAIQLAQLNGIEFNKKEMAAALWPGTSEITRERNINNLISGRTKRVELAWIKIICKMLKVDANFLFDVKPVKSSKND